jgi:DNA-binding LacI/PurR family transcriptional regulator
VSVDSERRGNVAQCSGACHGCTTIRTRQKSEDRLPARYAQAVQHLAALGHVRSAFISGPVHQRTAAMRRAAFQECMTEIGLRTIPELLFAGHHTMEGGMKAMSALSARPDRPSAAICSNDLTAIGVMRQAFDLSVDVPRDLSVHGVQGHSHGPIHDSGR